MIIVSVEELAKYPQALNRLVELARERDIESEKIKLSAIKGGADEKEITAMLQKHYY
jgi:hypothetical protein